MKETTARWLARRDDLEVLDTAAFSARQGVRIGTAMVMLCRLCGARLERLSWFTLEGAAAILAPRPAREAADELGLAVERIYALRFELKAGTIVAKSAAASAAGEGRHSASTFA